MAERFRQNGTLLAFGDDCGLTDDAGFEYVFSDRLAALGPHLEQNSPGSLTKADRNLQEPTP